MSVLLPLPLWTRSWSDEPELDLGRLRRRGPLHELLVVLLGVEHDDQLGREPLALEGVGVGRGDHRGPPDRPDAGGRARGGSPARWSSWRTAPARAAPRPRAAGRPTDGPG